MFFKKRKVLFFAKKTFFRYDTHMNEETQTPTPSETKPENVSSIQNEEQFHDLIQEAKSKIETPGDKEKYDELAKALHEVLHDQDSEKALVLITRGALGLGSSDIHYDTGEKSIAVRLRIDGELRTVVELEKSEYKLLVERLKYKSNLKLNITEVPQDGKYRITEDGSHIDVRVSTLPVRYGENAVCRILDSTKSIPPISDL